MKQISNTYALTALGCIGGLLFGFDIASMSAILPTENYKVFFGDTAVTVNEATGFLQSSGLTPNLQGGVTAAMPGGSFVGSIISGYLSDRFGRNKAIMVASTVFIIGSILTCASHNIGMLIVGRFICGSGIGIASAQVPVYISEIAPAHLRGRLVGCQQWAITWGIMIFYYISLGCSYAAVQDGRHTITWRLPWGLQMIPAVFLLIMSPFMPASPRWLASKGRYEEALEVLALIHGKGDKSAPIVVAEFKEITESIEEERGEGSGYIDLLRGGMAWRTHIAIFTQIWSQLTGMNVMMYYISYVFEMAGVKDSSQAVVSSSIQYVINVVMTVPALIYIDRWGRRPTLLVGAALMATWLFSVAGIMATRGHLVTPAERVEFSLSESVSWRVDTTAGKGVIACSYLFVASYAPTWGPVSWVYPPELFNTRLRGKAGSVSTSFNWLFNFALSYFVPPAFSNIQWKSYIIFGVFCVTMFIHVFFAFPETKGKSLEEIDEIFQSNVPAWRSRKLTDTSRLDQLADAVGRGENIDKAESITKSGSHSPGEESETKYTIA